MVIGGAGAYVLSHRTRRSDPTPHGAMTVLLDLQEIPMALWTAPIVEETPVGLEVTSYSPAEL